MNDNQKAAKAYLQQIKQMDERVQKLQEDVEILRNGLILPALSINERVSGSKKTDTFENKMAISLDKQLELAELAFEYELFRDDLLMKVLDLEADDIIYSEVLYNVYFKFMKLIDVAKKMDLSRQYIFHIHPKALAMFYDQFLSKDCEKESHK